MDIYIYIYASPPPTHPTPARWKGLMPSGFAQMFKVLVVLENMSFSFRNMIRCSITFSVNPTPSQVNLVGTRPVLY